MTKGQANRYDVDFHSCLTNSPTINLRKMGFEKVDSIHLAQVTPSTEFLYNNNIIYLFTAIVLSPGGSGYSTCKQK